MSTKVPVIFSHTSTALAVERPCGSRGTRYSVNSESGDSGLSNGTHLMKPWQPLNHLAFIFLSTFANLAFLVGGSMAPPWSQALGATTSDNIPDFDEAGAS